MALDALRLPEARLWGGLVSAAAALKAARPTATNLAWAVDRVLGAALARSGASAMRRAADREAGRVEREEHARSLAIARAGVGLMPRDATVLTICNTGPLAAPPLGTALGVVLLAHRQGLRPRVYACETRPLLQGARLTAFELSRAGVPVTLIVDSAAASVIDRCDLVLVGADRIARNGDTANKVGTRMLAQLAQGNRKPFYVAAPLSTFDLSLRDGSSIPIEERDPDEVRRFRSCSVAPARVAAFNPAFDVTPARFIDGFITDAGLIRPPCSRSIVAASRGR
jgi:methylthioribose-1-phosphate isomerase